MSSNPRWTTVLECLQAADLHVWRTSRYGNEAGNIAWLRTGALVNVPDDGSPIRIQGQNIHTAREAPLAAGIVDRAAVDT